MHDLRRVGHLERSQRCRKNKFQRFHVQQSRKYRKVKEQGTNKAATGVGGLRVRDYLKLMKMNGNVNRKS